MNNGMPKSTRMEMATDKNHSSTSIPGQLTTSEQNFVPPNLDMETDILKESFDKTALVRLRKQLDIDIDDRTLARFFIGAEYDEKIAFKRIQENAEFRRMRKPHAVRIEEVERLLKTNQASILDSKDKLGNSVVYCRFHLHDPTLYPLNEEFEQYIFYVVENAIKSSNTSRVTAICDIAEVGWKNVNLKLMRSNIHLYNNHYPETLGFLLILRPGYIFTYLFRIGKPLLGPRTISRIHLINTETELEHFIDLSILPKDCCFAKSE
ncbi:hypothetical protein ACOME3_001542 [Neoechinorhynchus agilis]